jgi:YHS domain-containing protein
MRTTTLLIVLAAALAAPAGETPKVDPVRIPAIVDLNNTTCPSSGDEIKGDAHVDWNGVRIHLCCNDCKADVAKDPAAMLAKLHVKVVKDGDKTIVDLANATCPVSSKPAKADATVTMDGVCMHVCCNRCPKAAEKDPAAACKALGYTYIPSVVDLRNATCPMSGKPVKADVFADHDGIRVHFCCPNCPKEFEKDPAATFAKLGVDPAKVKEATK